MTDSTVAFCAGPLPLLTCSKHGNLQPKSPGRGPICCGLAISWGRAGNERQLGDTTKSHGTTTQKVRGVGKEIAELVYINITGPPENRHL